MVVTGDSSYNSVTGLFPHFSRPTISLLVILLGLLWASGLSLGFPLPALPCSHTPAGFDRFFRFFRPQHHTCCQEPWGSIIEQGNVSSRIPFCPPLPSPQTSTSRLNSVPNPC